MKFGLYLPTCAEGTFYPRGILDTDWLADLARQGEEAGFYELSVSDYISTGQRNRRPDENPPNYLEALSVLAWLAGITTKIRLLTNVIVAPNRNVVILAKELTTLDQLSRGRLLCGLGLGANRDEFESIHPRHLKVERGGLLDEMLEALSVLLTERTATYTGKYVEFRDVELYPKAYQDQLPIYVSGDTPEGCQRAARWGHGWISFSPGVEALRRMAQSVQQEAGVAGRPVPALVPMVAIATGISNADATRRWQDSHFFQNMVRSRPNATVEEITAKSLVGSPETISAQIADYAKAGVGHMTLIFAGNTHEEIQDQLELFIHQVAPLAAATS
jgi:probable F420-dependent oxidoreductase